MRLILCALLLFAYTHSFADSIYDLSVTTIDGQTISLSHFKGRKIMIVILQSSPTDTILPVAGLKKVQAKYPLLIVIGITSLEAGFKKNNKAAIKKMYKTMLPGFILTETLQAGKATGAAQAPLLQWLTHWQRNKHFNEDVKGPGFKYFIDERGELYGAMDPKVKISSAVIDRVIQRN